MKLRNVFLVLSLGIILAIPTTVSATEYDTTGPNDELSEEEIEALDTVEDEYDVSDYDYSGESTSSGSEGTEATTPDNPVFESDDQLTSETTDTLTSEDEGSKEDEETEEVETPKTGDNVMYYAGGLLTSVILGAFLIFHKER